MALTTTTTPASNHDKGRRLSCGGHRALCNLSTVISINIAYMICMLAVQLWLAGLSEMHAVKRDTSFYYILHAHSFIIVVV